MIGGFKVGGNGVKIKNGRAYGSGVYTSCETRLPVSYSKGSKALIMSRALVGKTGKANRGVSVQGRRLDSWEPTREIRVFRDAAQLLPVYVIYFN